MKVDKELVRFWSENKEHGDVAKIARMAKVSHSVVSRVVNGEQEIAKGELVKQINRFYRKRVTEFKNSLRPIEHLLET